MAQDEFKDALDRAWKIDITTAALKRLRVDLDFALDDIVPVKLREFTKPEEKEAKAYAKEMLTRYQDFLDDDVKFGNVLWSIVRLQAAEKGITQEQFDEGLRGEFNQAAIAAFHWSFTNFSAPSRKSFLTRVKTVMVQQAKVQAMGEGRMKKMEEIGLKKMEAELTKEIASYDDAKLESIVDDAIAEASKPPAGN